MSILIKGMEMPQSCYLCHFLFRPERHGKVYCTAVEQMMDISETISDERANDCPIIELPLHGRLIDADEFFKDVNESVLLTQGFKGTFNLWFDEQPTIIEAERDER